MTLRISDPDTNLRRCTDIQSVVNCLADQSGGQISMHSSLLSNTIVVIADQLYIGHAWCASRDQRLFGEFLA